MPLRGFLLLCFGLSWASMPLFMLFGGRLDQPAGLLYSLGYMWVPGLCALAVIAFSRPPEGLAAALGLSWRPNRFWLLAWLAPAGLAFATLTISLLLPGVEFSPEMAGLIARLAHTLPPAQLDSLQMVLRQLPIHPIWLMLLQGLLAGATLNALAALGEELAWRGLLLRELGDMGFWQGSGIIGLIWGLWHAPLILMGHNYLEHPRLGVLMMLLWCLLLAPPFSWVRLRGRSVLAAALLHGSLNGTLGLAIALVSGGNDLLIGGTGLAGMLALAGVNLALWLSEPDLRHGESLAALAQRFD